MGIDFPDLLFRLERQFKVKLNNDDFLDLASSRNPPDVLAGELPQLISDARTCCNCCHYDLRGHGVTGACPECGEEFSQEKTWELLRNILSEVAGLEESEIRKDSLLIKNLGMT